MFSSFRFRYIPTILLIVIASVFAQINWNPVRKVITDAIADEAFPGAVALVANRNGIIFAEAFGNHRYDLASPKMDVERTIFDLASMTKVLVTTTAVMQFYERGELSVSDLVTKYLPEFGRKGKHSITLENLLLHNSGLKPDPVPGFWTQDFGCPESSKEHPLLSFNCLGKLYDGIMDQPLQNPIGEKYVYSDLSMMTMHLVIGELARVLGKVDSTDLRQGCPSDGKGSALCYYDAYVRSFIVATLELPNTGFLPDISLKKIIPPAWKDDYYRHELIHGYVSDPNAYAYGGIAGHAGLFSNVLDVYNILGSLMFSNQAIMVNSTTLKTFIAVKNVTQSSRALGWDTNSDGYGSCGDLSETTYLHTGYTGTNCCNDPKRELITILLTNRVYPDDKSHKILKVRTDFNVAVRTVYDQRLPTKKPKGVFKRVVEMMTFSRTDF